MKIAILGYGLQGRSVYNYLKNQGHDITICNKDVVSDLPKGVSSVFGSKYLANLDRFDLIYRSPIIHPKYITEVNGPNILDKVTSNTNEFFRVCPSKNIIGVTGTKGKGTTSTLIAKMLEASGFRVHLGGNIGTPPLELLEEGIKEDDWVVLELANFQLIDLKISPKIAVCLIVSPEHLDWHTDVEEYYHSKTQLFRHQQSKDITIYYADNDISKRIATASKGHLIPYYDHPGAVVANGYISIDNVKIIPLKQIKLLGKHNLQNVCAAVTAVWQVVKSKEALASVLREFRGLPFRIELRRKVKGVSYFDDSFASAPAASAAAIAAISGPKIVILGGKDRGLDLSELIEAIKEHTLDIKKALIIGESGPRLANELEDQGFTNLELIKSPTTMEVIVKRAASLAKAGDSVLLSPAFPSFDMFNNFEDRGQQFNQAVEKL